MKDIRGWDSSVDVEDDGRVEVRWQWAVVMERMEDADGDLKEKQWREQWWVEEEFRW